MGQMGYYHDFRKESFILPSSENKTTKGSKEEPGLYSWVYKVNSLQMISNVDRNSFVDWS